MSGGEDVHACSDSCSARSEFLGATGPKEQGLDATGAQASQSGGEFGPHQEDAQR